MRTPSAVTQWNDVTLEIPDDIAQALALTGGFSRRALEVLAVDADRRSSIYNRLKLGGTEYFSPIGYTGGWGHFHIPDNLFADVRDYLREIGHSYADQHHFGEGPNWRMPTTRAALESLGFSDDLLRHGIEREVFLAQLADNALKLLRTGRLPKTKPIPLTKIFGLP